jgi:hypothetical protein
MAFTTYGTGDRSGGLNIGYVQDFDRSVTVRYQAMQEKRAMAEKKMELQNQAMERAKALGEFLNRPTLSNPYDEAMLAKYFEDEIAPEYTAITTQPGWEYNPESWAKLNQIKGKLVNNEHIERFQRVKTDWDKFLEDERNGKVTDEYAAEMHKKYQDYSSWTNLDKPNPEFSYEEAKPFDSGKILAENADRLFASSEPYTDKAGNIGLRSGLLNPGVDLKVETNALYLDNPDEWNREFKEYQEEAYRANMEVTKKGGTVYPYPAVHANVLDWLQARLEGYAKPTDQITSRKPTGGSGSPPSNQATHIWTDHMATGKIYPAPGDVVNNPDAYLLTNSTVENWTGGARIMYNGNTAYIPDLGKNITFKSGSQKEILDSQYVTTDAEGFTWVTTTMEVTNECFDSQTLKELEQAGLLIKKSDTGKTVTKLDPATGLPTTEETEGITRYTLQTVVPLVAEQGNIINYIKHAGRDSGDVPSNIAKAYMTEFDKVAYLPNAMKAMFTWNDGKSYTGEELINKGFITESDLILNYKQKYVEQNVEPAPGFPTRSNATTSGSSNTQRSSTQPSSWTPQGTAKQQSSNVISEDKFWNDIVDVFDNMGMPYVDKNSLKTTYSSFYDQYKKDGNLDKAVDAILKAVTGGQ